MEAPALFEGDEMDSMVVRRSEALAFTTNPTDVLRFLCPGNGEMPDITDETLAPGDGPPLHRHPWMTWEVVVEGRLLVRIGDRDVEVGDGDMFFTGPGVPHSFMVIGDGPARLIGVNWPGGFHHLYAELSAAFTSGAPDFAAMAEAAQRHGAEILGPPLAVLLDSSH
jgi:mannose-6-phosphate isomerase-like protein (cupin superfamily)